MPKEQLRLLAGDVERLLGAGSNVAVGDTGLQKRSKALRDLSAKVPVLKQIADSVDHVTQAKPSDAGRKLLDLLLIIRQARASLTTTGAEGEITSVPPSGPWATKSSVHDVTLLKDALMGTGEAGFEEIKRGLEKKAFADLRLVQPILDGLANSAYAPRADLIALEVIPSLGGALYPELRQQFDVQGKSTDARRLKALCKTAPAEGAALCRQVLTEGSKELKPAALEMFTDLAPAEAESIGLEMLSKKTDQQFRAAALKTLAHSTQDAALEALLQGIDDTSEVWTQAHESLGRSPHPQATNRLLTLLQEKLEAWKTLQNKKESKETAASKGKGKKPTREQQLAEAKEAARRVLFVLQSRGDPQSVPALLPLLQHKDTDTRVAALQALAATRNPQALAAIIPFIEDTKDAVWQTAMRATMYLPPAQHFDLLAPKAKNLFATKGGEVERASYAIGTLLSDPKTSTMDEDECHEEVSVSGSSPWDPRWGPVLLRLLEEFGKEGKAAALVRAIGNHSAFLAVVLVRFMGQEALPHLLRVLPVAVQAKDTNVIAALGEIRRKEAAQALVEQVATPKIEWNFYYTLGNALAAIGDKSVLPRLQEIRDSIRDATRQRLIDYMIQNLQTAPERSA